MWLCELKSSQFCQLKYTNIWMYLSNSGYPTSVFGSYFGCIIYWCQSCELFYTPTNHFIPHLFAGPDSKFCAQQLYKWNIYNLLFFKIIFLIVLLAKSFMSLSYIWTLIFFFCATTYCKFFFCSLIKNEKCTPKISFLRCSHSRV